MRGSYAFLLCLGSATAWMPPLQPLAMSVASTAGSAATPSTRRAVLRTLLVATPALALLRGAVLPAFAADEMAAAAVVPPGLAAATFAGGCFWCVEADFDKVVGVEQTISGYCGGKEKNPTYRQVSDGRTGHAESLQVIYDPKKVSYAELLDYFWHHIDPTTKDQQFCDSGHQYRSAIFYSTPEEKQLAEASKAAYMKSGVFGRPLVTEIVPATEFWPAEEYHQNYYINNPERYYYYRTLCGRDRYLSRQWGAKPAESKQSR